MTRAGAPPPPPPPGSSHCPSSSPTTTSTQRNERTTTTTIPATATPPPHSRSASSSSINSSNSITSSIHPVLQSTRLSILNHHHLINQEPSNSPQSEIPNLLQLQSLLNQLNQRKTHIDQLNLTLNQLQQQATTQTQSANQTLPPIQKTKQNHSDQVNGQHTHSSSDRRLTIQSQNHHHHHHQKLKLIHHPQPDPNDSNQAPPPTHVIKRLKIKSNSRITPSASSSSHDQFKPIVHHPPYSQQAAPMDVKVKTEPDSLSDPEFSPPLPRRTPISPDSAPLALTASSSVPPVRQIDKPISTKRSNSFHFPKASINDSLNHSHVENSLELSSIYPSPSQKSSKMRENEASSRKSDLPRLTFGFTASQVGFSISSPEHVCRLTKFDGPSIFQIFANPTSQSNPALSNPKLSHSHPSPSPHPSSSTPKLSTNSLTHRSLTPLNQQQAEDFAIADYCRNNKLVYPPLPVLSSTILYPKTQGEVNQDFSKLKPTSNQVPFHQFQNWVNDHYLRSFGQDDLAFLASEYSSINGCPTVRMHLSGTSNSTGDPLTSTITTASKSNESSRNDAGVELDDKNQKNRDETYLIPTLGRHYSEVWRGEDLGIHQHHSKLDSAKSIEHRDDSVRINKLSQKDLSMESLARENVQLGPLTERLISSIYPSYRCPASLESNQSQNQNQTDPTLANLLPPKSHANSLQTDNSPHQNHYSTVDHLFDLHVIDHQVLESRISNELKLIGILDDDEIVDWNQTEDDEISIELRKVQSVLRLQSKKNQMRKERLIQLVKQRIGFQEFDQIKDGLDRLLIQSYNQKQVILSTYNQQIKQQQQLKLKMKNRTCSANANHNYSGSMSDYAAQSNGIHNHKKKRKNIVKLKNGVLIPQTPTQMQASEGFNGLSSHALNPGESHDEYEHEDDDDDQDGVDLDDVENSLENGIEHHPVYSKLKAINQSIANSLAKRHEFITQVGSLFNKNANLISSNDTNLKTDQTNDSRGDPKNSKDTTEDDPSQEETPGEGACSHIGLFKSFCSLPDRSIYSDLDKQFVDFNHVII